MCIPFEPRAVDQGDAANADLADIIWDAVLGTHSAEEGVPGWVVSCWGS